MGQGAPSWSLARGSRWKSWWWLPMYMGIYLWWVTWLGGQPTRLHIPPPNGDVLVTSQKEKRMKDKEKKRTKQCKKKSSTKKTCRVWQTEKQWKETEKHEKRNKDLIQMRRTQARSIPPLPLETTSSSMVVMGESSPMPWGPNWGLIGEDLDPNQGLKYKMRARKQRACFLKLGRGSEVWEVKMEDIKVVVDNENAKVE